MQGVGKTKKKQQQINKVWIHAKIMTRVAFNTCKEVKMIDDTTQKWAIW